MILVRLKWITPKEKENGYKCVSVGFYDYQSRITAVKEALDELEECDAFTSESSLTKIEFTKL